MLLQGFAHIKNHLNKTAMKQEFFECEKHNSYWRKKAIEAMPCASKIVPVAGGYIGFESWIDYELWKNQK